MQERPAFVDDVELLALIREHWDEKVDRLEFRPVGFGAHHWLGSRGDDPAWFVTIDELGRGHDARSLEAAYAGAAALRGGGLEFLHAPVSSPSGRHAVPWAPVPDRPVAVSVTEWLADAVSPPDSGAEAELLARLHAAPPPGLPTWKALVGRGFGDALDALTSHTWSSGPFGEQARSAIRARLETVRGWLEDYLLLASGVDPSQYVATHGEPGLQNQLVTNGRVVLVDTESMKLAPPERDVARVAPVDTAWTDTYGAMPDPDRLLLFALEWRLDEIGTYAAWFSGAHSGNGDDRTALSGLYHELGQPQSGETSATRLS